MYLRNLTQTEQASFSPLQKVKSPKNTIDLWLVHYQEIVDPDLLISLRQLLSSEERCREQRFHFPDDRKRFLVTRATVRTVLSRYAPVAPADWTFAATSYGRPFITNPHPHAQGLDFNLSHTNGLIVLGICRERKLGVDVENIRARKSSPGIAERFFTSSEYADLIRLPKNLRHERFFEYWTFKESYIKARGQGLSIPLDRFHFSFPQQGRVQFAVDAVLKDDANQWQFWQFRLAAEYLLAVCAERRISEPTAIFLRSLIPTIQEEHIHATPRVISHGAAGQIETPLLA